MAQPVQLLVGTRKGAWIYRSDLVGTIGRT